MHEWQNIVAILGAIGNILQISFLPVPFRIRVTIAGPIFAGLVLLSSFFSPVIRTWLALIFVGISIVSFFYHRIKIALRTIRKKFCIWIARKLDTQDLEMIYAERLSQSNHSDK